MITKVFGPGHEVSAWSKQIEKCQVNLVCFHRIDHGENQAATSSQQTQKGAHQDIAHTTKRQAIQLTTIKHSTDVLLSDSKAGMWTFDPSYGLTQMGNTVGQP